MARELLDQEETFDDVELSEWLEALEFVIRSEGPERVRELLNRLRIRAEEAGIDTPLPPATPYVNTIPAAKQPPYPGDLALEARIENIVRWNAAAMVVRANRKAEGIGGHLASFASAATLYQVGFNHFFRGPDAEGGADQVFFQGHSSPGIYAEAFLEGRLTLERLENFRRELSPGGGLSSYPHPWLMRDFWQFPTVSMGLGPLMAVYHARFNRYLLHRGLKDTSNVRVWAFLGDGETDEPEALAAIRVAAREHLDNLTFVVNCNLQRLDGPVRGNGKIVQELEAIFRGAGWHVIKVLWSSDWDPLFANDPDGLLAKRLGEIVDGELQKAIAEGGAYMREHVFAGPRLRALVDHLSDQELANLRLGGHDPVKVYAAFRQATLNRGAPTVILAQTVKGYKLGALVEARNVTHEQKELPEEELLQLRDRLGLPIADDDARAAAFYRPSEDSREVVYLRERRRALGGPLPKRRAEPARLPATALDDGPFGEFAKGSDRKVSTTMVMVRLLTNLLRHPEYGRFVVPIVPDEARTFGMEGLFRLVGIYSPVGQLYEPVDAETLLPYREVVNGQILQEGITEAGSMASFIAAGTAPFTHGVPTIPFFWFYANFGLQRVGDLVWAAAEMRTKGFLVAGLAGRTQLQGEGLQHADGGSHLLAYPVPTLRAYDPAFAYEIAAIVKDGLRRMYVDNEDAFYYLTVGNESYLQPPMPSGVEEGIIRGLYLLREAKAETELRVQLLGSGAILNEVLAAQELLAERYGVAADVWSVTSYKELYREARDKERLRVFRPQEAHEPSWLERCLAGRPGPVIAASDYVKALPDSIARWVPAPFLSLGTDGFGRSATRAELRDFFEVDRRYIAFAALSGLFRSGRLPVERLQTAMRELDLDPEKANPAYA